MPRVECSREPEEQRRPAQGHGQPRDLTDENNGRFLDGSGHHAEWSKPEPRLELNSQRELADAVAARVTDARGEDLSECALTVNTLSQIVARIIEV
jgi:hypothetical protein